MEEKEEKKKKKKRKRDNAGEGFSLDEDPVEDGQEGDDLGLYFDGEEIKFWIKVIALILAAAVLADGACGFKVVKTLIASASV